MTRVRDTPDLGKEDVSEPTQRVYDDIDRTLRVPFVNFIFRTLANFPDDFLLAWQAVSPHLRRLACERAGDHLRSLAANEIIVESLAQDILSVGDQHAVVAFIDAIHYVLPKLLLTVTAFDMQASGDFSFRPREPAADAAQIPYGIAQGTGKLTLLDPVDADAQVRGLFEDIQNRHAHPGQLLSRAGPIPDVSRARLVEGSPSCGHGCYQQRKQTVLAEAETFAARELVRPASDPTDPASDAVRGILAVFRYRLIPDSLLDVTLIKAMRDGPQAAAHSRFSAVG